MIVKSSRNFPALVISQLQLLMFCFILLKLLVNYTTERILYEKFLFSSHYDAVMEAAPPPPPACFRPRPAQSDMGEKCILVDWGRRRTILPWRIQNFIWTRYIYFVFMVVPENKMKKQAEKFPNLVCDPNYVPMWQSEANPSCSHPAASQRDL